MDLRILYEDENIVAVEKPAGVLSEDAPTEKGMVTLLREATHSPVFLLHRLDRNVGGVMVFAKNKKSAAELSRQIQNGSFKKSYVAISLGVPSEAEGIYKDFLFKDSKKNRSFVVKSMRKGVREASLEYKVLKECEEKALLFITLHTGRTHQIRVQFSSRKTPLLGDTRYGGKDENYKDIALHSRKIEITHPSTGEHIIFESAPDYSQYPWSIFGGEN